jgi:transcriptional regulator with XRE-family HTH domain
MYHKFKQYPNSLRKYRKTTGLCQREVAHLLGLKTAERLSRWENGSAKPMPRTLFLLAQIYHVPVQELFSEIWGATSASAPVSGITPLGQQSIGEYPL